MSVVRWRAARCEGRGFGRLRGTVWAGVVLAATRRHAPKRSMRPPDSEKVPKIDPGDDSLKREDRQQKNRVFLCMFLLRVTTAARGIGVESGGAEHKYRASLSPPTEEHTQPPLKVGSVRCDTAAAVAAASWRGGPLYCAGSILARLPPSIGGVERCSKGHPKHTTHTHTKPGRANTTTYRRPRRRRRRAPKHRWPCSPPGQPRGAVGGWAPASNLPAPCWPHRTKDEDQIVKVL